MELCGTSNNLYNVDTPTYLLSLSLSLLIDIFYPSYEDQFPTSLVQLHNETVGVARSPHCLHQLLTAYCSSDQNKHFTGTVNFLYNHQ